MEVSKSAAPGETNALDAVMPQMYDELRRLAAAYMRREREGHTLDPTALVHETYLRLTGQHSVDFNNRAQVLGVAAKMMRRILLTHEETRRANKRGGEFTIVCLTDAADAAAKVEPPLFSEVDEVLCRLEKLDERQSKVAELKIFGGLTGDEIAEYLQVSPATVQRDWISGRLWLMRELRSVRLPAGVRGLSPG